MASPFEICRIKGEQLQASLTDRLALRDVDPPLPALQTLYDLKLYAPARTEGPYAGPAEMLATYGRPMDRGAHWRLFKTRPLADTAGCDPYKNYVSVEFDNVLCWWNFKDLDATPAFREAFLERSHGIEPGLGNQSYIDIDGMTTEAAAVLGTPNAEGVVRMLANYADTFGWKKAARIRVFNPANKQYHLRLDLITMSISSDPLPPKKNKLSLAKQRRLERRTPTSG
ncbi:hypothetical protein F5Y16DRAFT_418016 [Xylariaceae sp. FL0255]|nr:hypothetical protein F5Y16DRAFT_418016 [Xylariaceae sp. FL0255]